MAEDLDFTKRITDDYGIMTKLMLFPYTELVRLLATQQALFIVLYPGYLLVVYLVLQTFFYVRSCPYEAGHQC